MELRSYSIFGASTTGGVPDNPIAILTITGSNGIRYKQIIGSEINGNVYNPVGYPLHIDGQLTSKEPNKMPVVFYTESDVTGQLTANITNLDGSQTTFSKAVFFLQIDLK